MPPIAEITFYRGFDMPVTRYEQTPDPVKEIVKRFLENLNGRSLHYEVEEFNQQEGRLVIRGDRLTRLEVESALGSAERSYKNFWGKDIGMQIQFRDQ